MVALGLFALAITWVLWVLAAPFKASPEALEWLHSDLDGVGPLPEVVFNSETMGSWLDGFELTAQGMSEFAGVDARQTRNTPISVLAPYSFIAGVDELWERTDFAELLPEISRRRDWRSGQSQPDRSPRGSPLEVTLIALSLHGRLALFRGEDSLGRELFAAASSHALLEARYSEHWLDRYQALAILGHITDPKSAGEVDGNPETATLWREALESRYQEVGGIIPALDGLLQLVVREQWRLIDEAPSEFLFRKGETKARILEEIFSIAQVLRSEGAVAAYQALVDQRSPLATLGGWVVANPKGQRWQAEGNAWQLAILEGAGIQIWLEGGASFPLQAWHPTRLILDRTWTPLVERLP